MSGNINAGKVFVELELKYSKFMTGIRQFTASMTSGFGSAFDKANASFTKFTDRISKTFSAGRMLLTGGIAAAAGMLVKKVADAGTEIDANSKKMGVTPEEEQFYDYAAKRSSTSVEEVGAAIRFMNNVLDDAKTKGSAGAQALDKLNLSVEDFIGLTPAQKFDKMAAAIAAIADPAEQSARMVDVFGRSGTELRPMIQDLDKLKKDFKDFGSVMSNEAVASAVRFNTALADMHSSFLTIAGNSKFLKYLSDIVDELDTASKLSRGLAGKQNVEVQETPLDKMSAGEKFKWITAKTFSKLMPWLPDVDNDPGITFSRDSAEEKKALELHGREFNVTHETTRQKKDSENLMQQIALANRKKAEAEAQVKKAVEGLEEQIKLQDLLNNKLERKAAIEKALYDAQQGFTEKEKLNGRKLTQPEIDKISEKAGNLYDLQKEGESKKMIEDMDKEVEIQDLINKKKERQAEIEKAIYEKRKTLGRELEPDENKKITEDTGKLFDLKNEHDIQKQLDDMKEKTKIQDLLNEGEKRKAAIEEALDAARKIAHGELDDPTSKMISDSAGKLFDAQHQKVETSGSFYAYSLSMQAGGSDATERTAKATEAIVKNTKETNQLLKDNQVVFQ